MLDGAHEQAVPAPGWFHRQRTVPQVFAAALRGDAERVVRLVEDRPDSLNLRDPFGRTLVHVALATGNRRLLQFLLQRGAGVNVQDDEGDSPLHLAARHGDLAVVATMLRHGANLLATDRRHRTPLQIAALRGRTEVVRLLRRKGARLALLDAVVCRFPETTRRLLDEGADPDAIIGPAGTALHYAARLGEVSVAAVVLAAGANPNRLNRRSRNALHEAAQYGAPDVAEELIQAGARLDALDANGDSPLDLAVAYGHADVARRLAARRAPTTEVQPPSVSTFPPFVHRVVFPYSNRTSIGVCVSAGDPLLVDPGWLRTLHPLAAWLRERGYGQPRVVINTHDHPGHTEANVLAAADTIIVRGPRLPYLASAGIVQRREFPGDARRGKGRLWGYLLPFDGEQIWLFPCFGLHSSSDLLVYFAMSGVLFVGDVWAPGGDGSPRAPSELVRNLLRALPPGVSVVQGHGPEVAAAAALESLH